MQEDLLCRRTFVTCGDPSLSALAASLARLEETAAIDRRHLTSALSDSVRREQRYSEQIRELQTSAHKHQAELQALHTRENALQQRVAELEKLQMKLEAPTHPMPESWDHTMRMPSSIPSQMPNSQVQHSQPTGPLPWTEYVSSAQRFLERRAQETYAEYLENYYHSSAMPSQDNTPAAAHKSGEQRWEWRLDSTRPKQTPTSPPDLQLPPPIMQSNVDRAQASWRSLGIWKWDHAILRQNWYRNQSVRSRVSLHKYAYIRQLVLL